MNNRSIALWRLHTQRLAWQTYASVPSAVEGLLGVQAENYAQASWALATRAPGTTDAEFDRLFDAGEFLRTHVLRPTWHFVRPADIRWLVELTAPRVMRSVRSVADDLGVTGDHMERSTELLAGILAGGAHLSRDDIRERLTDAGLPTAGARLGVLLMHAEQSALVVSGRVNGGDQTYALLEERAPNSRSLDRDEAVAELVLRYFTGHGPATERDLSYWGSMTLTDVRRGISEVSDRLESFDRDGQTFWFGEPPPRQSVPSPRAHILQTLDEYHNGYQDSRYTLDADGIVPRGSRASMGMVLIDGQMVGGMRRRLVNHAATFQIDLHRKLTGEEHAHIQDAAARYGAYLGLEPEVVYSRP